MAAAREKDELLLEKGFVRGAEELLTGCLEAPNLNCCRSQTTKPEPSCIPDSHSPALDPSKVRCSGTSRMALAPASRAGRRGSLTVGFAHATASVCMHACMPACLHVCRYACM